MRADFVRRLYQHLNRLTQIGHRVMDDEEQHAAVPIDARVARVNRHAALEARPVASAARLRGGRLGDMF
jgi:hypothetical protein